MRRFNFILVFVLIVFTCNEAFAQSNIDSEDFNGCALPAGWTSNIVTGDDAWLFGTNGGSNIDGNCMAYFDDDAIGSGANYSTVDLQTPSYDVSGYSTLTLSFDYNFRASGSSAFIVYVWDGAAWQTVLNQTTSNCGAWGCSYPSASIDVSAHINSAFTVLFRYDDGDGWAWYCGIDNYSLDGCVSISAPTTIAATNLGCTDFDANWNAVGGATKYYLDVDDNADFSSPLGGYNDLDVGNVTSYNVSGLSNGTTYYYRVRAYNGCQSSNSNSTSASTLSSSTAPTTATASSNPTCGGNTTISISDGTLGTGATWEWYSGSCGGTSVGSGTSVVVAPGANTTYYVRAEGTCNTTSCDNVAVTVESAPAVPTSTAATGTDDDEFTANWNAAANATSYRLDVDDNADFSSPLGGYNDLDVGNVTTYNVTGLSQYTTYYYRVRAYNDGCGASSSSNTINETTSCPPTNFLSADFSSTAGWTQSISGGTCTDRWNQNASSNAGGTSQEMRCAYQNCGVGTSRWISPAISTTGQTSLDLSFKHYFDYYSTNPTIKIQSSTDGVSWTDEAWSITPTGNITATTVNTTVVNNLGGTTYIAWVITGDLYEFDYWYVDDVSVDGISIASTDPTSINATTNPTSCPGDGTTLSVVGGSLGTGATWEWYSGSCGGTSVGSGTSVVVNPTANTTYYVRAEGTCNNTSCASLTINVTNTNSTAPTGATADDGTICNGGSTNVNVSGGSLGTGATWEWYTGSCGGTSVGSGATLAVSPASTTTYYVRAEGTCNTTTCQSVVVNVDQPPTTANAGGNQTVCESTGVTMAGNTPVTGSGTWTKVSGPAGESITTPSSPTTTISFANPGSYVFRWTISNGVCTDSFDDVTITVDEDVTAAAAGGNQTICETPGSATMAANSPTVGTGAWTQQSGPNTPNIVDATSPTTQIGTTTSMVAGTYVFRWTITNGTCSDFDEVTITVDGNPTSANAGPDQNIATSSATMAGNNPATGSGTWTYVSGPGGSSITTPTSPTTTITNLVNGTYVFRWTIANGTCTDSFDEVTITNEEANGLTVGGDLTINGTLQRVNDDAYLTVLGGANTINGTNGIITDAKIRVRGTYSFAITNMSGEFDTMRVDDTFTLTVEEDLETHDIIIKNTTGTITMQDNETITLSGDWINDGAFNAANSTVAMVESSGTVAQNISGNNTTTFNNFTVNNTKDVDAVTLNVDANIDGTLTLTSGDIVSTSTDILTLGANATVSPVRGSASSFVSGYLARDFDAVQDYEFPIGRSANGYWRPITMGALDATARTWTIGFTWGNGETDFGSTYKTGEKITTINSDYYFMVSRAPATGNVDVKLWYDQTDITNWGFSEDRLIIGHWDSGNNWWDNWGKNTAPGNWVKDDVNNWIEVLNVGTFSPIGPGDDPTALPIELNYFRGYCTDNVLHFDWSSHSERNNDYFELYYSADNKNFTRIEVIEGAGNSNSFREYSREVNEYSSGYFKLIQVDYNGETTAFETIYVSSCEELELQVDYLDWDAFINSDNTINIAIQDNVNETYSAKLYDEQGRELSSIQLNVVKGDNIFLMPTGKLATGLYLLKLEGNKRVHTRKLFIH